MARSCHAYAKVHMRKTRAWADAINARDRAQRRMLAVRFHEPDSRIRKKAEQTYWSAKMRSEDAFYAALKTERALAACQKPGTLRGSGRKRRR